MSDRALRRPKKNTLTESKKETFRKIVGNYSTKVDLNAVRTEWKNHIRKGLI